MRLIKRDLALDLYSERDLVSGLAYKAAHVANKVVYRPIGLSTTWKLPYTFI